MKKRIRLLQLKEEEGIELSQEEYLELKLAKRDQEHRKKALKKGVGITLKALLIIVILGVTVIISVIGMQRYYFAPKAEREVQKRKAEEHQADLAECDAFREKISTGSRITYYSLRDIYKNNNACTVEDLGYERKYFSKEEYYKLSPEERPEYPFDPYSTFDEYHAYFVKIGDESGAKICPNNIFVSFP